MNCASARDFCGAYLRHQKSIKDFVGNLAREEGRKRGMRWAGLNDTRDTPAARQRAKARK
jgi:hypothetical protein